MSCPSDQSDCRSESKATKGNAENPIGQLDVSSDGPCTAIADAPRVSRHLRAPKQNFSHLIDPPLSATATMLAANATALESAKYDLNGCSLACVARKTKQQLSQAAWNYSRQYRDVAQPATESPRTILAGHQPELFHPGVWLKNFMLGHQAAAHGATAINLVIDSDTIKRSSLRVPSGSPQKPVIESICFDRSSPEIPWELRGVVDHAVLGSFADRAGKALAPLVPNPMLHEFWPLLVERAKATGNLGAAIAQARHQWEGRWGLETLEIPQSEVCELEGVLTFTAHLLSHLPRLWEVYNAALVEFRHANHVRSSAHPVPELATQDEWLEAPFWIYTKDDPRRRRLFVRQSGDRLLLSNRAKLQIEIEASADLPLERATAQLADLQKRGIFLRTRALVTTMTARVLGSDLFLHGIGGGKYDQLTDTLIERFFGMCPPTYQVVSGTLHLPVPHEAISVDALHSVERDLRQLSFHPERFLVEGAAPGHGDPRPLVAEKARLVAQQVDKTEAKARCRAIRATNEALQPWIEPVRADLVKQSVAITTALEHDALLSSREYSFCLFPTDTLKEFVRL